MKAADFKVGQVLWYVPNDRRSQSTEIAVTKVGRRWVECRDLRFDAAKTMRADGGAYLSPGRFWLSETEWRTAVERRVVWLQLRSWVDGQVSCPAHLDAATIARVRAILEGKSDPGDEAAGGEVGGHG